MIAFGPVPSRRLGKSIGINNIPPKACTYSCVYCQLGKAGKMTSKRQTFYDPEMIINDVQEKIINAEKNKETIDYLTFVADGEPTLDENLGNLIKTLKQFGKKIAVITNSSLIHSQHVRDALCQADWVSVKVDAADSSLWRKINRSVRDLNLDDIFKGILQFSQEFNGTLVTETMLVKDLNDSPENIKNVSLFIKGINPEKSYISIPIRPPAEKRTQPPEGQKLIELYQIFQSNFDRVEYLTGYEGNDFAYTGNIEKDILSITSVHPMTKQALLELTEKSGTNFSVVEGLVHSNRLVVSEYNETEFYLRKF